MYAGARLSELIAPGPLATDRLLAIGTSLAETVAAAHAEARAIGALTPSTVFVDDAGTAHLLDSAAAPISARCEDDLLALGALLYAMATGKAPYSAQGAPPGAAETAPPCSPIEFNPRLPSGLVQLIRRAVHPDDGERFRSVAEIVDALREVRRAPSSLESLLPSKHVSSSAAVKLPPRPDPYADDEEDQLPFDEQARGLPFIG
jgi:serine/threonine protein kinase